MTGHALESPLFHSFGTRFGDRRRFFIMYLFGVGAALSATAGGERSRRVSDQKL